MILINPHASDWPQKLDLDCKYHCGKHSAAEFFNFETLKHLINPHTLKFLIKPHVSDRPQILDLG